MTTPAACPIDGKSDKTQPVTEVISAGPSWLQRQLKRPEIPPQPQTGSAQSGYAAALSDWEARVHQAVAAQTLWDSRLYYCYDHNVIFLAGDSRYAPPEEVQRLLDPESVEPPLAQLASIPTVQPAPPLAAQSAPETPTDESRATDWEYCDIIMRNGTASTKYVAQVYGPRGMYEAMPAQTVWLTLGSDDASQKHATAVYRMALQLHANGWEYVGQDSQYWFHYRFRRRTIPQAPTLAVSPPTLPLPHPGATSPASGISGHPLSNSTPVTLSDVASTARQWVRGHVSSNDEQRLKDAVGRAAKTTAEAAKNVGHVLKDAASTAMAQAAIPNPSAGSTDSADAARAVVDAEIVSATGNLAAGAVPAVVAPADDHDSAHTLRDDFTNRLKGGAHYIAMDHAAHIRARQYGDYLDRSAGQRVLAVVTTMVEMIPLDPLVFLIPVLDLTSLYGLGDLITLVEGVAGRTIDGLHLSLLERIIYLIATAIPGVPARPVVGVYRRIEPWLRNENTLEQRAASAQMLHSATGTLAGAGWLFLLSQLPPWLRRSMPDIHDQRYPRPQSFRVFRTIAAFLWTPCIAYYGGALIHEFGAGDALAQQVFAPGIIVAVTLVFIAACVLSYLAYRDRLRETLTLAIRENVAAAHEEVVGRVNEMLWQQGSPVSGKLAQSLKHAQDVSLKTAKGIALSLLKQEGLYLLFAVLLVGAFVGLGVALILTGLV